MRRIDWHTAAAAAILSLAILVAAGTGLDLLSPPPRAGTLTLPKTWSDGETITAAKLNSNPVAIANVINGNINDANIAAEGITGSTKLADDSVTNDEIAADTITHAELNFKYLKTVEYDYQDDVATDGLAIYTSLDNVASVTFTTDATSDTVMVWCWFDWECTHAATRSLLWQTVYDCGGGDQIIDSMIGGNSVGGWDDVDNDPFSSEESWFAATTAHTDNASCTFKCQASQFSTNNCTSAQGKILVQEWAAPS